MTYVILYRLTNTALKKQHKPAQRLGDHSPAYTAQHQYKLTFVNWLWRAKTYVPTRLSMLTARLLTPT